MTFAIAIGVAKQDRILLAKSNLGAKKPLISSPFACSTKYSPGENLSQKHESNDPYRGFSEASFPDFGHSLTNKNGSIRAF